MRMVGTKAIVILRACLVMLALVAGIAAAPGQSAAAGKVVLVDINGAIGITTVRLIARAIEQAKKESADAVVLRLDTPGGLVSATRDIVRDMTASPIPIIVYVA